MVPGDFDSNRWQRQVLSAAVGILIILTSHSSATAVDIAAAADTPSPFLAPGQTVALHLQLLNHGDTTQELANLRLTIENHTGFTHQLWASPSPVRVAPNSHWRLADRLTWAAPTWASEGAYFFVVHYTDSAGDPRRLDAGFIRIFRTDIPPTTYTIDHEQYRGMDIFKLRGGMSAEYAVQKALANLAAGVSHSWYTQSRGRGPDRVHASPQFLEESVRRTVAYYDKHLGEDEVYDTVILSTGVATVPYLSHVTKAPVLPLHFLVSAGSVREVRAVLDHSRQNGTDAYAVLGYDASMPNLGVAWIKLLDLPEEYRQFLIRHKTRRVLIVGTTGTFGETLARRVLPDNPDAPVSDRIGPDDIYMLYTSASGLPFPDVMNAAAVFASDIFAADLRQIERRIHDVHQTRYEDGFSRIADWESGVSQEQLDGLAGNLRRMGIDATLFSVEPQNDEVLHLYDLATYLMQAFFEKNREQIAANDGRLVRGVAINPYMISQPFYESRQGYLPFLFWQGNDVNFLADHAAKLLADNVGREQLGGLHYWVNVTHNFNFYRYPVATFTEQLSRRVGTNLTFQIEPADADEVWDLTDGINASCERVAEALLQHHSAADLKRWNATLTPLTLDDLKQVQKRYPRMVLRAIESDGEE